MNPRVRRTESARLQMQLGPRLLILLAPICLVGALASVSSAGQLDRFYPATYAPALSDTTGALVVRPARGDTVQVDIIFGEAGGRLSGRVVGPSDEGDPPVGGVIVDAESGAVHLRRSELEPGDVVLLRYHREEIRLPGQPDADDDSADSHVALVDPSVCIAKLIGWEPGRVAA